MPNQLLVANHKMNLSEPQALSLVADIIDILNTEFAATKPKPEMIICPVSLYLTQVQRLIPAIKNTSSVKISAGAQNVHFESAGAFTGEISATMLQALGIWGAIIGHSERRTLFGETDNDIAQKLNATLHQNLYGILCIGETLSEREANTTLERLASQLTQGLSHINADMWDKLIIAYEPVWAIGTGKTASPAQAKEVHDFIRQTLLQLNPQKAGAVPILYGGSVKASNAAELFSQPNIDGALVGGASLNAREFADIYKALAAQPR